jgi:hypothetical protein
MDKLQLNYYSINTKIHELPQITAKETIFTGQKIDIDDHAEFYHNKYYFFLQDYQVFFSKDAL